jgi:hypothetical protein
MKTTMQTPADCAAADISSEADTLLRGIIQGNYHCGGLKCVRLFRVDEQFFAALVEEVKALVQKYTPSAVKAKDHVTNWTNPYGTAVQFSLLNESGKFDDYSTDHNRTRRGKRFHRADEFPSLARFIDTFPHAYNMRLNGMGKKSGLSPHEEHVVSLASDNSHVQVRARFHLPIATNPGAEMLLDGELFHFEAGSIFFFNNGCIHSATNSGEMFRYHFVWDTLLDHDAYNEMFVCSAPEASFLQRVRGDETVCRPLRQLRIGAYAISGEGKRLYDRLKLKYLLIKPHWWQNLYNRREFRQISNLPVRWWESATADANQMYGHDVRD